MDISTIQTKTVPVLQKYNVKKAALFGSQVSGAAMPDSDVDIIVDMPSGTTLFRLAALSKDLEKQLNTKVDILTYNGIHPLLQEKVQSQEHIFYTQE